MSTRPRWKTLTVIAETGDRFADFAPYVASINDGGTVAFQAALPQGGTGIFAGDGAELRMLADSRDGEFGEFYSHPDIAVSGVVSFYASLKSGERGVFRFDSNGIVAVGETPEQFSEIGPLGPTMNDAGMVAFRATAEAGGDGVFAGSSKDSVRLIGDTIDVFSGFYGLPVVDHAGAVVFRANLKDGGAGIYLDQVGAFSAIVETGELFTDLGAFPSLNNRGSVAFCGTLETGGSGVFTSTACAISAVVDTRDPFESFRGALINDHDEVIFYAVPHGGKLGIFAGPDPVHDQIVAIGDEIFGSAVSDLALNPVSFNNANQIAVRLKVADGRQFIVRAEPDG